jgi:hypothetical protein
MTWEVKTRRKVIQDGKHRQKPHFISRATITLKFDDTKDEYVTMAVKEDIIEGFRGSEFDSEKVHSIGVHIAQKKLTHFGQVVRLAKTIATLDDIKEKN